MNEQKQEGALAEGARRANGAKAPGHRSERGRFSCQRKREAVCVFCGARAWRRSAASWARQRLGFPPGARRSFAGARRRSKPALADERDEENARLKAKVGELTMEGEVLREKIDRLEAGRPLAGRRWRR